MADKIDDALQAIPFPGDLRQWYAGQALIGLAMRLTDGEVADLAAKVKGGRTEGRAAFALADAIIAEGRKT